MTTKASAFMFCADRETCRCALIRDTAALPRSFHGPGCDGGGTLAPAPAGTSAKAMSPAASALSTLASVAAFSTFQDMIDESRLGSAAAGAEQPKGDESR